MATVAESLAGDVVTRPRTDVGQPSVQQKPAKRRGRRAMAACVGLAVAAAGCWAAVQYWTVWQFMQFTNDAYVKADSTIIAPRLSGYVAELLVDDNQSVKAGKTLARIDDRDFRVALDEATANVAAAAASVDNLNAQITAQGSQIRQADASVAAATASLSFSQRNGVRRRKMAQVGYGSEEQADNASTDATEKAANLQRLQAAALSARQQVDVLSTQRQLAQAQLARAEAARRQAELNVSYATITAPIDGTVAARAVRLDQYVQAGTLLMALVPLERVYVIANFKETQLTEVHPNQPARIRIDTFPGDDIEGHVETLAPASGLEFSLLPPDNATGNFTKIVQRIPVKIVFTANAALAGRLRPGMSVDVAIDTRTNEVNAVGQAHAAGQANAD